VSPEVKSKVYSTTEAQMSAETVVIVEFELACKNHPKVHDRIFTLNSRILSMFEVHKINRHINFG